MLIKFVYMFVVGIIYVGNRVFASVSRTSNFDSQVLRTQLHEFEDALSPSHPWIYLNLLAPPLGTLPLVS
jgi:hypothetical protein